MIRMRALGLVVVLLAACATSDLAPYAAPSPSAAATVASSGVRLVVVASPGKVVYDAFITLDGQPITPGDEIAPGRHRVRAEITLAKLSKAGEPTVDVARKQTFVLDVPDRPGNLVVRPARAGTGLEAVIESPTQPPSWR